MRRQMALVLAGCFTAVACGLNSGCSSDEGELDTIPISGTITCNGEALEAGVSVQFVPTPDESSASAILGKLASGVVQADGSFTLSTYGDGDGAVVGRHRIIILPAASDDLPDEDPDPDDAVPGEEEEDNEDNEDEGIPLPCPTPGDLFVEITAGTSVVNIEMADGGSVTTE